MVHSYLSCDKCTQWCNHHKEELHHLRKFPQTPSWTTYSGFHASIPFWALGHNRDSDNTGPSSEREPRQRLELAQLCPRPHKQYLQFLKGLLCE